MTGPGFGGGGGFGSGRGGFGGARMAAPARRRAQPAMATTAGGFGDGSGFPEAEEEGGEGGDIPPPLPATLKPSAVPLVCMPWQSASAVRSALNVSMERDAARCMARIVSTLLQEKVRFLRARLVVL